MTLGITIIILLLILVLMAGVLLLVVGLGMLILRRRPVAASQPPAPVRTAKAPAPAPRHATPAPQGRAARSAPPPPPSVPAPPPALGAGLLGFFDDEPVQAVGAPREVESAKTELFQRGKMAIDWDEEEDEGEATEIFSAHGAAGDLAEFAFEDEDQSTGRFGR